MMDDPIPGTNSFAVSQNKIKKTASRNIYLAKEAGFSASYATELVSGALCV